MVFYIENTDRTVLHQHFIRQSATHYCFMCNYSAIEDRVAAQLDPSNEELLLCYLRSSSFRKRERKMMNHEKRKDDKRRENRERSIAPFRRPPKTVQNTGI